MNVNHLLVSAMFLLPCMANATSCLVEDRQEFNERRDEATKLVVKEVLNKRFEQAVLKHAMYEITVSEVYMIANDCISESDSSLMLRGSAITHDLSWEPAAFYITAKHLDKNLKINLLDLESMFHSTIVLTNTSYGGR